MHIKSTEDRIVDIVAIVFVTFAAIFCLYPIIFCFSMSLSGDDAIVKHSVKLFPQGINFESYRLVLSNKEFLLSFKNSVVYTVVGTLISLFCNLTLGMSSPAGTSFSNGS